MRASSKDEQRRLAVRGFGEVADVDDQRPDVAHELFLVAQRGHPGAAALGGPREIIAEEQPDFFAVGIADVPYPHIGMPDRHVGAGEGQAEQAARRIEGGLDHAVEVEKGLDLGLVELAQPVPQLLGVVAPVPGLELEVAAFLLDQRLHGVAIGERARARRGPHRVEELPRRLRRLRHRVVEPVMGEVGIAEEPRPLGAEPHHLGDESLVVGRPAIVAAHDKAAEDLLAQVAAVGKLQERLDARPRQRDGIAVEPAVARLRAHRLAHEIGQAGQLRFAFEPQRKGLLVGEHVLAERGAELGKPLDNRGKAFFRFAVERGAGAAKARMVALGDAFLFGIEPEAVGFSHHRIDAAEQRRIAVDLVPMAGDLWRKFALDFEQRIIGVRAGEEPKRVADALQRPPAQFQRRDRIRKARWRSLRRDGGDLGLVLGKRARIGLPKVLGRHAVEGWDPIRGGPGRQKRIGGGRGLARGLGRFGHCGGSYQRRGQA